MPRKKKVLPDEI
jgi:hypothetical protein